RGLGKVPRLADLIRQKAEEAAARRAPAAPPPDPDGGAGGVERRVGSSVFGLRATVARGTTRRIPCLVFLRSYKPAGNNSGADRAHCSMKLRTRSASCQMSSYCCWVIGMTICLAPRGTCVEGVFRSRSTCRVFGRASILAPPSLERSRMTKMPPAGYRAFLQYLQSGRVSNPESRVKAAQGPAAPWLVQNGWTVFLVKVHNKAGVTAELQATSPNAEPIYKQSTSSAEPKKSIRSTENTERWMDLAGFRDRPLKRELSGLAVEYRIIQVYSRDAGQREAKFSFNIGQGSQDLGFRSDADILFPCDPAVLVVLDVKDQDGRPTMASFIFRDRMGRVYPSPSRRLAPDFFFHPQI